MKKRFYVSETEEAMQMFAATLNERDFQLSNLYKMTFVLLRCGSHTPDETVHYDVWK